MERKIKFVLKIKNYDKLLYAAFGPGVIAEKVLTIKGTEEELEDSRLLSAIIRAEDDFIKEFVEVAVTEI